MIKGLQLMHARKISLVDHVWTELLIIKAILGNNMTDRHTGRDAAFMNKIRIQPAWC